MKIGMYLGTSKDWWAYLGVRSNPCVVEAAGDAKRAIVFDDPPLLPEKERGLSAAHYFFVVWDGVRKPEQIEKARAVANAGTNFTALVVGDLSRADDDASVLSLYPAGKMQFDRVRPRFDLRTWAILFLARVKGWLMPLKNVRQAAGKRWATASLLFARPKVVFCGVYGLTPPAIAELCDRSSIDPGLAAQYESIWDGSAHNLESYRAHLRRSGLFLAGLYDESVIDGWFLQTAVHLLGREYFILKWRETGAGMFVHNYGGGNINVYTTPFYRQHLFLDFGSTAGPGNYPRLADLSYFRKRYVSIDLRGEPEELAAAARNGELEHRFEAEWDRMAGRLPTGHGAH